MDPVVFEVKLHQKANNLDAMVQVVSTTSSHAKRFVYRQFFPVGWEIVEVKKIRDI